MPRKCSICERKDRNKIDSAVAVKGASLRSIAAQYSISLTSLRRHVNNGHIAEKIVEAQHIHDVIEADTLLSQMQAIKKETWVIHKECRERKKKVTTDDGDEKEIPAPDNDLALKAIARLEHQIEIEGKILQVPADPNSPTNTHLLSDEQLAEIIAKKKP